jgi:hypothetical protein
MSGDTMERRDQVLMGRDRWRRCCLDLLQQVQIDERTFLQ